MVSEQHLYEWAVLGAGPAGLAAVSVLLATPSNTVLWIDPSFSAGRLTRFPAVPSNTKVRLFLRYAEAICPTAADTLPSVKRMAKRVDEAGCELGMVQEMVVELTEWVQENHKKRLHCEWGTGNAMQWSGQHWNIKYEPGGHVIRAKRAVLCTGCVPISGMAQPSFRGQLIDPEVLLNPLPLSHHKHKDKVVAVVGNSHTAILILRNLLSGPVDQQPHRVYNFMRHPLRFAEYLPDGRIKYDNTGLKGVAAEWAREHLVDPHGNGQELVQCCHGRLQRIWLSTDNEEEIYDTLLPECSQLVWAIGYCRQGTSIPTIQDQDDSKVHISGHKSTGQLVDHCGKAISALYGMGIAFPERVIDPSGDHEDAVGLWKFLQTAKRIFGTSMHQDVMEQIQGKAF